MSRLLPLHQAPGDGCGLDFGSPPIRGNPLPHLPPHRPLFGARPKGWELCSFPTPLHPDVPNYRKPNEVLAFLKTT